MQSSTVYFQFDEARKRFGDRVDRYQQFLYQTDPLADDTVTALAALPAGRGAKFLKTALDEGIDAVPDAPAALKALFAQVDRVPFWVDWERIERGGRVFRQAALPAIVTLGFFSLPITYTSPAGSKPLVSTKQLVDRAARRLAETLAFVRLTCEPGALRRAGEGFKINLKVRLMHAQVRRLLLRSNYWNAEAWAMPINQVHMVGTLTAISAGVILKLQDLGFQFSLAEIDDILHLWRYSGYLSGVDMELIPATLTGARRLSEIILAVEGAPDEDSRALVRALQEIPLPFDGFGAGLLDTMRLGLARSLLGNRLADALDIPKSSWSWLGVWLLRPFFCLASWVRSLLPGGGGLSERLGQTVWAFTERMLFKLASDRKRHPAQKRYSAKT